MEGLAFVIMGAKCHVAFKIAREFDNTFTGAPKNVSIGIAG